MQNFIGWNERPVLNLINVAALLFATLFGTFVYMRLGEEGRVAQARITAWIESDRSANPSL
jgi:hypothetical protein